MMMIVSPLFPQLDVYPIFFKFFKFMAGLSFHRCFCDCFDIYGAMNRMFPFGLTFRFHFAC